MLVRSFDIHDNKDKTQVFFAHFLPKIEFESQDRRCQSELTREYIQLSDAVQTHILARDRTQRN